MIVKESKLHFKDCHTVEMYTNIRNTINKLKDS